MSTPILKDLYGLGFSPLSISNKKYAHAEELMANKEAGLLAIYQKDGSVISAEHLLRCKRHMEQFTQKCINDGTLGSVYKISPDDNLVQNVKTTQNLFTDTLQFDSDGAVDFRFIRFSIDFDCFAKESSAVFDPADIRVQINFSHKIKLYPEPEPEPEPEEEEEETPVVTPDEETTTDETDTTDDEGDEPTPEPEPEPEPVYPPNPVKSYNIEESLADINNKVYAIDYEWYPGDTEENCIILNSFDIILPTSFDTSKVGFVIHDILFAIK